MEGNSSITSPVSSSMIGSLRKSTKYSGSSSCGIVPEKLSLSSELMQSSTKSFSDWSTSLSEKTLLDSWDHSASR